MKKIKTGFESLMIRKASLWRRMLAFVIDVIIIFLLVSPLTSLFAQEMNIDGEPSINSLAKTLSNNQDFIKGPLIWINALISLLAFFYWVSLEYLNRQSIGKMILKISISSQLKELKFWQLAVRNLAKAFSITSISFVFLIDLLYMLFNSNGQRLTELLSKTEVINGEE